MTHFKIDIYSKTADLRHIKCSNFRFGVSRMKNVFGNLASNIFPIAGQIITNLPFSKSLWYILNLCLPYLLS